MILAYLAGSKVKVRQAARHGIFFE